METRDNINLILKNFGETISLADVSLDPNDSCNLVLDGNQNIQLFYDSDMNTLNFFTEVGTLPQQNSENCCNYLLKSNAEWTLTEGATLSKRKRDDAILLGYNLPILNLTSEIFETVFEHFLNLMDAWKNYLLQMSQGILPEALAEL